MKTQLKDTFYLFMLLLWLALGLTLFFWEAILLFAGYHLDALKIVPIPVVWCAISAFMWNGKNPELD